MKLSPEMTAKVLKLAPKPAKAKVAEPTQGEIAAAEVCAWCWLHKWPQPATEYRFAPPRRWRLDLAWVDLLLAVEFQGGVWSRGRHTRPTGFTNDCEKFSCAASLGWRLMPVTYAQLRNGMLLACLTRAMRAAA